MQSFIQTNELILKQNDKFYNKTYKNIGEEISQQMKNAIIYLDLSLVLFNDNYSNKWTSYECFCTFTARYLL